MSVRQCPQSDPKNPFHKQLEAEVTEWLTGNGYIVESNTYHDERLEKCPKRLAFIRRVVSMRNVNALIVRTRADRIALHPTKDISLCLEFKTIEGKYRNLCIEALPLAGHLASKCIGERCLYVFRDVADGHQLEGCFWTHLPIPIDSLWIPPRQCPEGSPLDKFLRQAFPGIEVIRQNVAGSGDPFIRIKREELRAPFIFPDWKTACLSTSIPDEEGTNEPKACTANGPYPAKASSQVPPNLFGSLHGDSW